ncbi:uncharacterized protein LOC135199120 isoform X2 [Macrobrachium nipponense]|uniref:uncharacterized protein LOC135199120 isoform X2 n=1 Tax=Macrobrachium nipponense TaxID=159736 RepID=UPI0030C7A9C9
MRTLQIWGCLLLLCASSQTDGDYRVWMLRGSDKRFAQSGSVMATFDYLSVILCAGECSKRTGCYSFNHGGPARTCELLNTSPIFNGTASMVAQIGWKVYTNAAPKLCPPGSAVIPYDVPNNQGTQDAEGYTCSGHSYFLDQLQKECRLKFYKDTDIPGNDVAAYQGLTDSYHEALRHCYVNKCAEVACDGALNLV